MTQKEFYHSRQWRRLSRTYLLSKNYICERCGGPAEIAHHKRYITSANINNPEITLNAENLEALCMECHNREHFGTGGAVTEGLAFDAEGNLIKERKNCHE
ncbi:MAG: HNH endonuclease [Clostridiales bacterium]|nr:HNH endonuclease [Clostridiales bacterium]